MATQQVLLALCTGTVLQVLAFLFLLHRGSMQPTTIWRTVVGYTQSPSGAVLLLINHFVAPPVGSTGAAVIFAITFLIQAMVFALPVWMLIRRFSKESTSNTKQRS
jgi:hypothetical protein